MRFQGDVAQPLRDAGADHEHYKRKERQDRGDRGAALGRGGCVAHIPSPSDVLRRFWCSRTTETSTAATTNQLRAMCWSQGGRATTPVASATAPGRAISAGDSSR